MSRGLGVIQQKIIAELIIAPLSDVRKLTYRIYFGAAEDSIKCREGKLIPTRNQINTIHRGVKTLAAREMIKQAPEITPNGMPCWILVSPVRTRQKIKNAKKRRLSVVAPAV